MQSRLFNTIMVLIFSALLTPVAAFGEEGGVNADRIFDFAYGLYRRDMHELAAGEYQKFLAQFPDNPKADEATFLLGESYFKLEDFSKANDSFNEYVTRLPDGERAGRAYYRIGRIEFNAANYTEAVEPLKKALTFDHEAPILVQINYYLGTAYFEMENFADAITSLKEVEGEGAAQLRPSALFEMATAFEKTEDHTNAIDTFNQLVAEFPDHELFPQALYNVSNLLFNAEEYEEAASNLKAIIDLQDEKFMESAQYKLAYCYYFLKDTDQFATLADEFLIRFPDSKYKGEIVFRKAELADENGDTDTAVNSYLEVIESDVKDDFAAQSLYNVALIYQNLEEYQKAVEAFDTLADDFPSHAQLGIAEFQAARIYERELDNPPEALTKYQAYLTREPSGENAELATLGVANCQLSMEQYDDMADTFEQFITNFPDSPWVAEAMYNIGQNSEKNEDYENAITYYNKMLATLPEEGPTQPYSSSPGTAEEGAASFTKHRDAARLSLARCYHKTEQFPEAAEGFYEILSQPTSLPEMNILEDELLWLGEYFAGENDYAKAVDIYKKLIDEGLVSKWAERCLYHLGEWHGKSEDWRDSILWYERMLDEFPDSEDARFARLGIAEAYENLKDFPKAIEYYEIIAKGDTTLVGARANIGLGNMLAEEGNHKEALRSYMYVAILYDDEELCSEALMRASECWLEKGDKKRSADTLNEILERYPNGPYSSEAEKRLQGGN